jgi:hypothetical protein
MASYHSADATAGSRYIPLMISRIMLSLRKAANSSLDVWSLTEPPTNATSFHSITFFRPRKVTSGRGDDIPLSAYPQSSVANQEK